MTHVRIDEGVKRGPRSSPALPVAQNTKPLSIQNMGKLKDVDPHTILQRYLSNETTHVIAADYGVTRQALSFFLLGHAEAQWKEAQVARALARKEKAEDDIELAADPLALARARESLKAAQWDLERVCRRIYGDKLQVEHVGQPILNITIVAAEQHGAVLQPIDGIVTNSVTSK